MLRHLLGQPEFSRTAVIINEFGEIGLDHELIEASEDSFIELQTGCLCCKIRTDLALTLQDLLQRRDDGRCAPFDRIVIETSGLADPAPILQTLMTDANIAGRLVLGGVVTTVDAVNGVGTIEREEVSQKQIAVADRIVLTKLDMAGPAKPALLRRLEGIQCRRAGARCRSWPDRSIDRLQCRSLRSADQVDRRYFVVGGRNPRTCCAMMPTSKPMRSCARNRSGLRR